MGYARERDVDLVVIETHGRTGYERYLPGSVAEQVVRTICLGETTEADTDLDRLVESIG